MNITYYLLGASIFLYFCYRMMKSIRLQINLHKLQGPPTEHWLLGNIVRLQDTPENVFKILREFGRLYYPIYNIWIGPLPSANAIGPIDMENILSNVKHIDKSAIYELLSGWLHNGLLLSKGKKWHQRRKILTPAFHFTILKEFIPIFNRKVDDLVHSLQKETDKPFTELNPYIVKFTLSTIAETAMGIKFHCDTEQEKAYEKSIHEFGKMLLYNILHIWRFLFWFLFWNDYWRQSKLNEILHRFTRNIISKREKEFEERTRAHDNTFFKKRLAMLDLLLTAKNDGLIDDEGIQEEVDTFMFEGHDTTAMALCFALMVLACNREAQEKIVEEIKEILGDLKTKPTLNDLKQFQYLERCIKEILRLYPSVPFISRRLGEDVITSTGQRISKDSSCHLHIYDLHHNPEIYPDPEKFDPDRFLPKHCRNRHPFAYLPFSAGPRNCIGQRFAMLELKTAIIGILSCFIVEPVDTPSSIVLITDLVLRTKENIKVKFFLRK